jgi:hypothetical protein
MHKIDHVTATGSNEFTEGDPQTAVPATVVTADFLNAIQAELSELIEDAGLTLDKNNNAQLATAVSTLIATAITNIQWLTYGGNAAYTSSTSFTLSGSDLTTIFHVGRRVKAVGATTGTITGVISASSFGTDTVVTIDWDDDEILENETLTIAYGALSNIQHALPLVATELTAEQQNTIYLNSLLYS